MLGTDVTCPEIAVSICGRDNVRMVFNHHQMRQSELYWRYAAGGLLGYIGICEAAAARTYCGLGAIAYGACAAAAIDEGKPPIAMEDFDRMAGYDQLQAIAPQLVAAMLAALPKGSGNSKKKARQPRRTMTTRGTPCCEDASAPESASGTR